MKKLPNILIIFGFTIALILVQGVLESQAQQSRNVGLIPNDINESPNFFDSTTNAPGDLIGVRPQLGSLARGTVNFPKIDSLLFTREQMNWIRDFERGVLFPKIEDTPIIEVAPAPPPPPRTELVVVPPPEKIIPPTVLSIREISLSGITYNGPEKWTIWLNGQRIAPNNIPEEILKLRVNNEFVEIIWHDKQTHKIYPVRLRPNQRFNLDSRVFLPG